MESSRWMKATNHWWDCIAVMLRRIMWKRRRVRSRWIGRHHSRVPVHCQFVRQSLNRVTFGIWMAYSWQLIWRRIPRPKLTIYRTYRQHVVRATKQNMRWMHGIFAFASIQTPFQLIGVLCHFVLVVVWGFMVKEYTSQKFSKQRIWGSIWWYYWCNACRWNAVMYRHSSFSELFYPTNLTNFFSRILVFGQVVLSLQMASKQWPKRVKQMNLNKS